MGKKHYRGGDDINMHECDEMVYLDFLSISKSGEGWKEKKWLVINGAEEDWAIKNLVENI